jgi:phage FluMu protein Com
MRVQYLKNKCPECGFVNNGIERHRLECSIGIKKYNETLSKTHRKD